MGVDGSETTITYEGASRDAPLSDLRKEILGSSKPVREMAGVWGLSSAILVAVLAVYALAVVVSAPHILFPDITAGGRVPWHPAFISAAEAAIQRYNAKLEDLLRLWACVGILCLPFLGFAKAMGLIMRFARATKTASDIDDNTAEYRRDPARLREKYRHQLYKEYQTFVTRTGAGHTEAVAIMEDALRLAAMDRWERANLIVDAQVPLLLSGVGWFNSLQRIALQLGILFSFIGWTMALSTEAFRGVRNVTEINLDPLIGALQVAFCSSIAALIASVTLIVMGGHIRAQGRRLVLQLEAMADNILNLAKLVDADPNVVSDLSEMRRANLRLASDVGAMRSQFVDAMAITSEAMRALRNDLHLAKEVQATFRDFISRVQKDDLARGVEEGVTHGVRTLVAEVNANIEATKRLVAITRELTRLEADRVANYNHVRRELSHIKQLIRPARPTTAIAVSINRTARIMWNKFFGQKRPQSKSHDD